jgi:mRNA interferase RelE/StbE
VASYRLLITASAAGELEGIPQKDRKRIARKVELLAAVPRPLGAERLSGLEKYRLRQGDYRILYSVDDADLKVVAVKIGHRRDVYR